MARRSKQEVFTGKEDPKELSTVLNLLSSIVKRSKDCEKVSAETRLEWFMQHIRQAGLYVSYNSIDGYTVSNEAEEKE